ncbi:MAG: type II toxin-antitoxin system MqsR family toxin [Myxococcota bacterium]|jgi:motility quorum-sensing regulator/GCU-specific mRNA interferase toxin
MYHPPVMEKRRPHHDLTCFKADFAVGRVDIKRSAREGADACGIGIAGMTGVIEGMRTAHFYKSMTSLADSREWQDVYHVPADDGLVVYVKFAGKVVQEFKLLSFKEK